MGETKGRIRDCESGRLSESADEQMFEELQASSQSVAGKGNGGEV